MKEGWSYKKLGEVCEILNGFAFKSNIYAPKGIRVIRITNVQKGFIEDTEPKFYPFDSIDELNRYLLKSQDLLISLTGNVGRVALLAENMLPAYLNQRVGCIRVKNEKELSISYLYHLLNSNEFEKNCIQSAHGAAQKNMSTVWLANYKIPIPPLQEQHSIVSRLDTAFSHIDALKANAEKQLNEARKLFQAELTECMKPKEGWEEKTLPKLSENLDSIRKPVTKKDRTEGIYPYYGASGIVDYVDNYLFDEDLLCISEDGANLLMRTYPIAFPISGKAWVNNHAHVLRFKCMSTQRYVEYYFAGLKLDEYITGAAQPKLTQKALNSIIISIPSSLAEQSSIVSHLDSLSSTIRKLEELQQKTLAECDALKQAMLREVFE